MIFNAIYRLCKTQPKISIDFRDGFNITSDNFDSSIEDSYLKSANIKEISINAYNFDDKMISRFNLKNDFFWVGRFSCEGNKTFCLEMKQEFENLINPMRTWYSPLYKTEPYLWIIPILVIGLPIFSLITNKKSSEFMIMFSLLNSAFLSLMIASFLSKFVLPRLVFNIGKSAKFDAMRTKVLYFLLTTVCVSSLVGLAVNYASDKILK